MVVDVIMPKMGESPKLWNIYFLISKSSDPMPQPKALTIVPISADESTLSIRAF